MARNRKANMSPAQRAAEIAAKAQGLADGAAGWRCGEPYRPYAEKAAELLPQFIAEVEKGWPELPDWAWDAPDDEPTAPPWGNGPVPDASDPIWQTGVGSGQPGPKALPAPDEVEGEPDAPPSGPRIRTIKDEGW